jgi:hypothetical protein
MMYISMEDWIPKGELELIQWIPEYGSVGCVVTEMANMVQWIPEYGSMELT